MSNMRFLTIKTVALKNNCPECYSTTGLHLTFKQAFVENLFYKSITDNVRCEIACKTCSTHIYPERWTDDIERVVAYQQKAFTLKPSSKRYKPLFWLIAIGLLVLIAAGLVFYLK